MCMLAFEVLLQQGCCEQVHLQGDKLHIDQEGRSRKFRSKVQQKTFAASSANGRSIMYVTERAVFKLIEGKGLELVEVAPGMKHCTNLPVQLSLVAVPMMCYCLGPADAGALQVLLMLELCSIPKLHIHS